MFTNLAHRAGRSSGDIGWLPTPTDRGQTMAWRGPLVPSERAEQPWMIPKGSGQGTCALTRAGG